MLTEYNGFKLGDRIYWSGNEYSQADFGTIVTYKHSVFFRDEDGHMSVWIAWDSDDTVMSIAVNKIKHEHLKQNSLLTNEQEAVMLLLSLGYTVSKNQK